LTNWDSLILQWLDFPCLFLERLMHSSEEELEDEELEEELEDEEELDESPQMSMKKSESLLDEELLEDEELEELLEEDEEELNG